MAWLSLLRLLLGLAQSVASYMHDKQLLDAGAAQEALRNLQGAQDAIARAKAARDAVSDDSASVQHDPDNRDNDAKPPLS